VDPLTDAKNCGECGKACAPSGSCDAGSCVLPAVCGNGKIEAGEECDGPQANCSLLGPYKDEDTTCTGCKADLSGCVPLTCGNNKTDPGEQCDGFIGLDCGSFLKEGFGGSPKCQPNCKTDLSACTYCGNGKRDEHEACEGGDLGGATCNTLGAGGLWLPFLQGLPARHERVRGPGLRGTRPTWMARRGGPRRAGAWRAPTSRSSRGPRAPAS
jgi:hypothetical protein